jgi:DNA-binding MarR family transcriptional regulator
MKIENVIKSELNPRQIWILQQLLETDKKTMKDLTTDFMSRVNLTNAIDVLEQRRFVVRSREANYNAEQDRRLVMVGITEGGKSKINSIMR